MLLLAMGLCGCGGPAKTPTDAQPGRTRAAATRLDKPKTKARGSQAVQPIVTAVNAPLGRVVSVNVNLRFAVIDFGLGRMPANDDRLSVFRKGLKVGEVKISGPQQDNNTIGDITNGEALPGDEVRAD